MGIGERPRSSARQLSAKDPHSEEIKELLDSQIRLLDEFRKELFAHAGVHH